MSLNIKTLSIMTLSIETFNIMPLGIKACFATLSINDTQHNNNCNYKPIDFYLIAFRSAVTKLT
jgi:hypothetical protein